MRRGLVLLLGACASCAPAPAESRPPKSVAITAPEPTAVAEEPVPAAAPARPPAARIDEDRVGDVRVGEPIPEALLARARYEIRWVADAQPFEAFRIADPPVFAVLHGGPFEKWAVDNVGELEPGRFADEAIAFAKAGAKVAWILIEERGPTTAEGIGVGSTWEAVAAAYPSARVTRDPEWFDPRPTCRVQPTGSIDLQFLLTRCDGENGDVVRVLVTRAANP